MRTATPTRLFAASCRRTGPPAAALMLVAALALPAAGAENWPNWRGPGLDGMATGTGYATSWRGGEPGENVLWRVPLPGLGASTPAVWGDAVVVTCGIEGRDSVICLDRAGRERWRRELAAERPGKHKKATGSNPSPVTDGTLVWVYFKSGTLACLRLADGEPVWQTNLQERFGADTLWWDLGTSPVLTDKAVIVAVMQSGPSYLAAFERATGQLLWKHDRQLPAPEEANQSYSTPLVLAGDAARGEPAEMLVVLGADHVTAHDAADGRELWRVGGLNPEQNGYFRSIASPVAVGDLVVAPYARGSTLTAIRRGGTGDVTGSHVAWVRKDLGADVPTPAAQGGGLVVCTDKGLVVGLEAATGQTLWQEELPKNRNAYSASPVIVDGRVIVTREDGASWVLAVPAAGAKAAVLGTAEVGEMTVATPVCLDGRIYLRTHDSLWCIGSGAAATAASSAAGAEEARPARILAVSVTYGFRHGSIPTAEGVLEELGRSSGLWHLDFLQMPEGFQDDPAWKERAAAQFAKAFAADSLADFDGVMFVSTTGELPVPDLAAFLEWLKSGKAFIGFHAATDTFKRSDAYVEMIGGHFAGHPWNAGGEHGFVNHEPDHPVAAMFPPRFRWRDEIYQYDLRLNPENLRVLVSLDMAASTPKEPWHVPVSWVRDYGQGRVFATNFGHNEATWKDPAFQKHATEGIRWALGRAAGPAQPNPALQAAEYLRSVLAAAAAATGADHDALRARADAKIAADPGWAVGLRPQLVELRGLKPDQRADRYAAVIAEIER